ncbi:dihydroxyacetone kinase subunit DhaL [Micropruina sp.]|uniref:dihydroxyacetone kinase subunit DhaL n=1 Tax=Micropruina sp. TaxID=2737536 RepID=UPI002627F2C8|nr:dihydroxyacetone kinase subunit DhaL [Micropruina sp.]
MAGSLTDAEFVVRSLTQTVIDNESYFGELDAVVGDGDFGYSLARGFEVVAENWDDYDRTDAGVFLTKIAMAISGRMGGTSGPIWGTAMLRMGSSLKGKEEFTATDVVAGLRAAVAGIQARGKAELGEKTLLDALVPAIDTLEQQIAAGVSSAEAVAMMAAAARKAADDTAQLQARRGRASYTGERSIGSVDAGAMAVAVILERLAEQWPTQ